MISGTGLGLAGGTDIDGHSPAERPNHQSRRGGDEASVSLRILAHGR
jgi:hypothetical protein